MKGELKKEMGMDRGGIIFVMRKRVVADDRGLIKREMHHR